MEQQRFIILAPPEHQLILQGFMCDWDYTGFSVKPRTDIKYVAGILIPPPEMNLTETVFRTSRVLQKISSLWYVSSDQVTRLEEIALQQGSSMQFRDLNQTGCKYWSLELLKAIEDDIRQERATVRGDKQ